MRWTTLLLNSNRALRRKIKITNHKIDLCTAIAQSGNEREKRGRLKAIAKSLNQTEPGIYNPVEDKQYLEKAHQRTLTHLESLPMDKLTEFEQRQYKRLRRLHTKHHINQERNAWALVLHALDEFQNRGINLFVGSKEDLQNIINQKLNTYERMPGYELTGKTRFVLKAQKYTPGVDVY